MKLFTQEEADKLISILKESLSEEFSFPNQNVKSNFEVISTDGEHLFKIDIYQCLSNTAKINHTAIIKKDGVVLLELHIGETQRHKNPDGKYIYGSHWHIYTEKHGRQFAIPAEIEDCNNFTENLSKFFDKFNLIKRPNIFFQQTISV